MNRLKDIIIWGVGLWGNIAYMYYKDTCNIRYFIDSDERKWNHKLYDIPICSPDILLETSCYVIVAIKTGKNDVEKCLRDTYGIKEFSFFSINEEKIEPSLISNKTSFLSVNSSVVHFRGGLGNQLFQYAFFKAQERGKKNVWADITSYNESGRMPFQLLNVFKNIKMNFTEAEEQTKLIASVNSYDDNKNFVLYKEPRAVVETKKIEVNIDLLKTTGGIFKGYFQTYRFADLVKKELLSELVFEIEKSKDLLIISNSIKERGYTSIHIRRGDFLLEHNERYFGNICTNEYYENAMKYIQKKTGKCYFCFFSDDMKWVKEHFNIPGAMYIDKTMFSDYQDWYDMYLMSICKHNIIANSTFSWWGAWLNQNPDKTVIAPNKWVNGCEYEDIYPPEWMKM